MRLINFILVVLTLVCCIAPWVPPDKYWLAGFLGYCIPLMALVNVLFMLFWTFNKPSRIWIPGIGIIMCLFYWDEVFGNWFKTDTGSGGIKVLSYNVRVFNNYNHLHSNIGECREFISWVQKHDAGIKCLQEFYNNSNSSVFNTLDQMSLNGTYNYYFSSSLKSGFKEFGMVIFSRFPIVNRGRIVFDEKFNNQVIFADIVPEEQDTIRVMNIHLASMSIGDKEGFSLYKDNWYGELFHRLRQGWQSRSGQVLDLVNHIKSSPYPVIVCGDLNDLPFSYAYQWLNKHLYNAFEKGGDGMGFTFNGKLFFLRIDNQFFGEQLSLSSFETMQDISYSDHYPLTGVYHLNHN